MPQAPEVRGSRRIQRVKGGWRGVKRRGSQFLATAGGRAIDRCPGELGGESGGGAMCLGVGKGARTRGEGVELVTARSVFGGKEEE